ncbi:hypothetical protein BOX15_Mlig007157g1 [Macrostomum lignano]|uniref:Cadherin domain-containing protein n=1 Tax=Macrostomum lignano TaxID=282301 RepID=A0A267EC73_9PLAT|nr:hypothetical protein BOX15_Mlig007157g1 [Macrostomum lignano]
MQQLQRLALGLLLLPVVSWVSASVTYLARQTISEGPSSSSGSFRLDALSLVRQQGGMPDAERVSFYKAAPPFAIESSGVIVLHGALDREQLCQPPLRPSPCADEDAARGLAKAIPSDCCVLLRLEARSAGGGGIREFHIRLDVEDINDSPPVFEAYTEQRFVRISEGDRSTGQEIRLPSATDADSAENGIAEYRLTDKRPNATAFDSYFSLIDATGSAFKLEPKLRVIHPLDREQVPQFAVALLAVDKGRPQLTGSLSFTIDVLDLNDHTPEIVSLRPGRLLRINETDGRYGKLTVATFNVSDPDSGDNGRIACHIRSVAGSAHRAERYFEVGPAQGVRYGTSTGGLTVWELRSVGQLDYEEVRQFTFSIVASDSGSPRLSSSVSLTVELINVDDHPMKISFRSHGGQKQRVEVPENQAPGAAVASVEVRDHDIELPTDYNRIECRLGSGSEAHFRLEEKPLIERMREFRLRTSVTFDREVQSAYQVLVHCRDRESSATATATLTVRVGDLNDNPPLLNSAVYRGRVEENCVRRTLVAMETAVKAVDPDSYPNNQILYRLSGGDTEERLPFSINAQGELYTEADLDFERRRSYTFNVTAYNQNNESQSSTAEVRIDIVDMNDNPPVIVGHDVGYRFSVVEEAAPLSVGFINATDEDTQPENRLLQFRILSPGDRQLGRLPPGFLTTPDADKYFRIDQRSGELQVKTRIDRETHPHFQFYVLVENIRQLQPPSAPRQGGIDQQPMHSVASPSITTVYVQVINVNDHPPRLCRLASSSSQSQSSLPSARTSSGSSAAICPEPNGPIPITFAESSGIAVGHAVAEPKCTGFPFEVRDADDGESNLAAEFLPRLENLTELVDGRLVAAPDAEFSLEGPQTLCIRRLPASKLERQEFRVRLRLEDVRPPGHSSSYDCRILVVRLREPPPPPPGSTTLREGGGRKGAADQFAEAGAAADRRHFVIVVSLVTVVVFLIVFAFAFVLFFYVRRLDNSMDKDCEPDRCVTVPLKTRPSVTGTLGGGGGGGGGGSGGGCGGTAGGPQLVTLLYNSRDIVADCDSANRQMTAGASASATAAGDDYNQFGGVEDDRTMSAGDFASCGGGRYEIWRDHRQPTGRFRQNHQQPTSCGMATPGTGPTVRRVAGAAGSASMHGSSSCEDVDMSAGATPSTANHVGQAVGGYQTMGSLRYQRLFQQQQQQQQPQQPVYSPKKSLKNTYFETSFV